MYCLATLDSGNYVFNLHRRLELKGHVFEVISLPCQLATGGCTYCLKFPEEYQDVVINESLASGTPVREIYRIVTLFNKNKYEKIY